MYPHNGRPTKALLLARETILFISCMKSTGAQSVIQSRGTVINTIPQTISNHNDAPFPAGMYSRTASSISYSVSATSLAPRRTLRRRTKRIMRLCSCWMVVWKVVSCRNFLYVSLAQYNAVHSTCRMLHHARRVPPAGTRHRQVREDRRRVEQERLSAS